MRQEVSAVRKTYDFILWLMPHLAHFSRLHRFTLGDRMEERALEVLELLVEASYTRQKLDLLHRANLRLEQLRYLIRLAKDMHEITIKQYALAAQALEVIGSEIGGWMKQQA